MPFKFRDHILYQQWKLIFLNGSQGGWQSFPKDFDVA